MFSFLRRNAFLVSMLVVVAGGLLTPSWGARDGHLHSDWLTRVGVVVIFLVQGINLSTGELRQGLGKWRLHLFTQTWIALGLPLLVLAARFLLQGWGGEALWTGLFFLAVLPTTVSSAVAFISHAQGNVPAGVFNTVFSNLVAVLLVPAWIIAYEAASGASMPPLWPLFRQLLVLLVLPFVIGHLLHGRIGRMTPWVRRYGRPLTQGIILFMVYAAFANSAAEAVWVEVGLVHSLRAAAGAVLLLVVASGLVLVTGRRCFGAPADRIAAFYCGSQKSLATGIPFALAIYAGDAAGAVSVSLVILPLMIYHPLQLVLAAIAARHREHLFGGA